MDEATAERKPYRMNLPMGASIVITVVVLIAAAVMLKPKRAS
jgi:hypothetical protein